MPLSYSHLRYIYRMCTQMASICLVYLRLFLFSWGFFPQDKAEDSADVAEPLYMIDNARFDLVFPA